MALCEEGKGVAMVFSSIPSYPSFSLCYGVCRLDRLMLQIPSPPQTANGDVKKRGRRKGRREAKDGQCRGNARRRSLCSEARCLTVKQVVLPETWEEPRARPTVVGNREQENSRRKDNNTKRQGRQMLLRNHRKGCKPQRARGRAEEACRCQANRVNGLNNLLIF